MRELIIYRLYFTESDCYRKGTKIKPCGVQVHSTGANNPWLRRYVGPDDGRIGPNVNGNTHNRQGGNVCASAYIGKLQDGTVAVYQSLPWNYRCWLSGSGPKGNANKLGYIGFEICEDNCKDRQYFEDAVKRTAVLLTAHLCQLMGVTPWDVVLELPDGSSYAVMDHASLHGVGLASNHGDIGLWLRNFGYTFNNFRDWVQQALNEGVAVEYVEVTPMVKHPTLRLGDSGEAVTYLQTLLCDVGETLIVDGKFDQSTEQKVKDFQWEKGLKQDGIVGPLTWAELEKATGHEDSQPSEPPDTVTISRADWNAIRAAAAVLIQTVKKYESVG